MTIEINVDRVINGHIEGWGWDKENPHDALTIELWRGPTLISAGRANAHRADVRKSGRGTAFMGTDSKLLFTTIVMSNALLSGFRVTTKHF